MSSQIQTGEGLDTAAAEAALAAQSAIVQACRKCEIGDIRRNAVYGAGRATARILIIGEGPGENEDKQGMPFIGRAGELLTKMLAAVELTRDDVYIANTVKCRPTLDEGGRLKNRPPTSDEMANCRGYLDEQIRLIQPDIILCLGAPAAKSFLGKNFAISRQRGQWFTGPQDIPLIVTFHPAYILRLTGGALNEVKRLVWDDLKGLRARYDGAEITPAPSADALEKSPAKAGKSASKDGSPKITASDIVDAIAPEAQTRLL